MTSYLTIKEAVAYTRVSTNEQGETGIGLEAQRAAIRTYADKNRISIIEWFEDVASGRGEHNLKSRLGIKSALAMAKRRGTLLLVDRLDRLSRHAKTIDKIIRVNGVMVIPASDELPSDPSVLAARAARAELEGKLISDRTKHALKLKKASGVILGNKTNLPEAQKLGAEANRLRSEKKAFEIADAIHRHGWHMLSVPALAVELNNLGVVSGRERQWTASALRVPRKAAMALVDQFAQEAYQRRPGFGQF